MLFSRRRNMLPTCLTSCSLLRHANISMNSIKVLRMLRSYESVSGKCGVCVNSDLPGVNIVIFSCRDSQPDSQFVHKLCLNQLSLKLFQSQHSVSVFPVVSQPYESATHLNSLCLRTWVCVLMACFCTHGWPVCIRPCVCPCKSTQA